MPVNVNTIVVSGNNIFAGTQLNGVYLSTNAGKNWTSVNTGLPAEGNTVNVLAISGSSIFAGTNNGMYLSTNNGSNWSGINYGLISGSGQGCSVLSAVISNNFVYAGTNYGVYLSSDNGSSWTQMNNNGLPTNASIIAITAYESNIFVGTVNGVYINSLLSEAQSWSNAGLNSEVYCLAYDNTYLYVGTGVGLYKRLLSDF